jgi:hypothetical protein
MCKFTEPTTPQPSAEVERVIDAWLAANRPTRPTYADGITEGLRMASELRVAANNYFSAYLVDEYETPEDCGISAEQHAMLDKLVNALINTAP